MACTEWTQLTGSYSRGNSRSTPGDFFMYKLLAVLNTRSESLILIINNSYNFAFIRIMFIYHLLKIASES